MCRILYVVLLAGMFSNFTYGQDTVQVGQPIGLTLVTSRWSLADSTRSVGTLYKRDLEHYQTQSLVSAFNSVPGVQMDERSPGSYRLSIRGSLLRSPFGVRNVKIYINDYFLTDAGGNSYLNLIDAESVEQIEIFKGPASSTFGANTGGAISVNLNSTNKAKMTLLGGSFGLVHVHAGMNIVKKNFSFQVDQAVQRSDGYRAQSGLNRKYFQFIPRWFYSKKGVISGLFFYSDLAYQTPGGLTMDQKNLNPRMSRPGTGTVPGASTQQSGVFNKSAFAGISNKYYFSPNWQQVISIQYLFSDFKNPFITNYETRKEHTIGLRSYVSYQNKHYNIPIHLDIGLESSVTKVDVENNKNFGGTKGMLMVADKLAASQLFGFARLQLNLTPKLFVNASSSLNFNGFKYVSQYPNVLPEREKVLDPEIMPAIAFSYTLGKPLVVRFSVSRGYSPPTLAEIRASDNQINSGLSAEKGQNYELGLKFSQRLLQFDLALFSFNLSNAIVRRVDAHDTEYFVNAGGTNQRGIELALTGILMSRPAKYFITDVSLGANFAYSDFTFRNYQVVHANYSGNRLPGVPTTALSTNLLIKGRTWSFFAQHAVLSSIFLDDGNSVKSRPYHLTNAKLSFSVLRKRGTNMSIQLGGENLLNSEYSLGHDLNAANGRYYNPAPSRNFYAGVRVIH